MKGLLTLIKLKKQEIDALRRGIASQEAHRQKLQQVIQKLEKELQDELALAERQPEMSAFFGDFAQRNRLAQQAVNDEIKKAEKEIERLREQVSVEFGELKKFEIARDMRLKRQKEERERQEQQVLDEIALQQYARKEE